MTKKTTQTDPKRTSCRGCGHYPIPIGRDYDLCTACNDGTYDPAREGELAVRKESSR